MKKIIYILWFSALSVTVFSQSQTLYNIKGDEAMRLRNYTDATIWYEEGVSICNVYSINQLTKIWLEVESMRMSMYSVMSRCLVCLEGQAKEIKDTASINNLILYYTKGIGTQINERTANFWRDQLDDIINPYEKIINLLQTEKKKNKTNVFIGYTANVIAPAGLTVGVVGQSIGGYVRYQTNFSSQKYTEICDEKGIIEGFDGYFWLGNKKANTMLITGGLVFKPTRNFLISAGAGYWKRDLMYEFRKINLTVTKQEEDFWAKNENSSNEGLAIDLDGIYRIGKVFYVSAGCSFMNFEYAYGNAGIGVFF
jgi:hypothetical protein